MESTIGNLVQVIAALVAALGFFVLVYSLPEKRILMILIAIIPIQLIDTRFGTFNTFLTYVVAFAFLLQGRLKAAPLLWSVFLLLLAYAISFSMSHPDARIWHVLYLISFAANFLLFYMVYNFIHRTSDWQAIAKALFVSNGIVVAACLIEIALGDNRIELFGVAEWTLGSPRASQHRLVGPFGSTHTTSDYLVTQCIFIAFWLIHNYSTRQRAMIILLALNFVCLIATGDRGGFTGFVIGAMLFLYLFREQIGAIRIVKYAVIGSVLFAAASFAVIEYTEFGRLYERLGQTEISAVDHPRASIFRRGFSRFQEKPIVGSGPRLDVSSRNVQIGDIVYRGSHPHNLILTILITTGIVGLIAWLAFFAAIVTTLLSAARHRFDDHSMISNLPKFGLLILFLFFLGELRIEFLRTDYFDYQNYRFVLFGMLIACAHILLRKAAINDTFGYGKIDNTGTPRNSHH